MVTNKFNKKPQFPFTYGDTVQDDDTRLSNNIVEMMKNERFRLHSSCYIYDRTAIRESGCRLAGAARL
jgi:hypothetical protein